MTDRRAALGTVRAACQALRGQSSARPPVIASIREFSAGPMAQQVRVPGASSSPARVPDELGSQSRGLGVGRELAQLPGAADPEHDLRLPL